MSKYLNYYEIQHTNTDFENLIHYLQYAVKENKVKITKEVVDTIIEITNKQELFEDELEKSYDEGYSEGYKDGKVDGKEDAEEDAYSDGYNEGHSDGYEKAKAEFEKPDIESLKLEYYNKGYRNGQYHINIQNDIAPDDLPF